MTTHELTNANPALQEEIARRKQVEEALRRQTEYMAALHSTTLGLISRLDLKDLLQNIVVRAGQLLGTPHGFMYLLTPGGEELERKVGVGVFNVDQVRASSRARVVRQGVANGPPARRERLRRLVRTAPVINSDLVKAMAGVPLRSGEQVVGVLAFRPSKRARTGRSARKTSSCWAVRGTRLDCAGQRAVV